MKYTYWSDEEFVAACQSSCSIAQVLKKFNIPASGEGYRRFKRDASRLNVTTSHFTGQASNKGKKVDTGTPRELATIFLPNNPVGRTTVKKALLRIGVPYRCNRCHISVWLGERLSLQLNHINGDGDDNRQNNLEFLCPNCHSQTPTFGGRNARRYKKA